MDQAYTILNLMDVSHYKEGKEKDFDWKWIQLPMKMYDRLLNKLILFNHTEEKLLLKILIHYHAPYMEKLPFIYYSPTRESLVYFDDNGYRLFGGVAEHSMDVIFSTSLIDIEKWANGAPIPIHPLTNRSDGWGMEFTLQINPKSSNYLYEWEFRNNKLHHLEELHSWYKQLLGGKKEIPH